MAEENDESIKVETALPIVFTIESLTLKALPIYVTILHILEGVLLRGLPFDFHNRQQFFRLSDDISKRLHLLYNSCFYVKLQRSNMDKEWSSGIIYGIYRNYFGLIQFPKEVRFRDLNSSIDMKLLYSIDQHTLCQDWMGKIDSKFVSREDIKRKTFKIRPPTSNENKSNRADLLSYEAKFSEDPSIYLCTKYYSILYSLKTPLSYFPKIAFTKMKLLCQSDPAILKEKLIGLRLSIEDFDYRHGGRLGVLEDFKRKEISLLAVKYTIEREHQQEFTEKYLRSTDGAENIAANSRGSEDNSEMKHEHENLLNLIMELKTREAQLQLLILFELFTCLEIHEGRFFENNIRKEETNQIKSRNIKRPSLVRKRNQNKRIIPTFLGMGILSLGIMKGRNEIEDTTDIDEYNIYKSLNFFIDRIGLWDTLIENSPHYGTCNMESFLDYVIIPYYRQRLPLTTKYILNKAKELTTRVKLNPEKRREQKYRKQGLLRNDSGPSTDGPPPASRSLSVHSNLMTTRNNSLKYEMSSQANILPFSLKKSKSSLSSGLNEKRQVDVSFSLKLFCLALGPRLPNEFSKNMDSGQTNSSNSFFFSRATKSKSQDNVGDSLQVEATPIKKKQKANYLEGSLLNGSPKARDDFSKRLFETGDLALKCPSNHELTDEKKEDREDNTQPYKVVEATPKKPNRCDINEELSEASGVMGSPVGCISSPTFRASSSPSVEESTIKNNKKPGTPVILEGAPFLTQQDFSIVRASDNDEDSIIANQYIKRASVKRKK